MAGGDHKTNIISAFCHRLEPVTYALLRVTLGLTLLTHGLPKITGGSHGVIANPFNSVMNQVQNKLHLPFPTFFASSVTAIETIGALCLAAGLLTRIVAPLIAVEMAVICLIEFPVFSWLERGMEYALLMGLLAFHISIRGPGRFSVDRFLGLPAWLVRSVHA